MKYIFMGLVLIAIVVAGGAFLLSGAISSEPQYIELPVAVPVPYPYVIEKTEIKYVEIPVLHTETEIRTIEIPIVYEKVIEKEIPYTLPEGYQAITLERAFEIIEKGRASHEFFILFPQEQMPQSGDTQWHRQWVMYYTELEQLIKYLANRAK